MLLPDQGVTDLKCVPQVIIRILPEAQPVKLLRETACRQGLDGLPGLRILVEGVKVGELIDKALLLYGNVPAFAADFSERLVELHICEPLLSAARDDAAAAHSCTFPVAYPALALLTASVLVI